MRGRYLWGAAILVAIIGAAALLWRAPLASRATCANAPTPLVMKGQLRNGNNQPVMQNGKPVARDFEISRADCANPQGQWRKSPAPVSSQQRSCGRIVDKKGVAVQTGEVCRLIPTSSFNMVDWISEPRMGTCQLEGIIRPHALATGSFAVTLELRDLREGPNCGTTGLQPPRNQTFRITAQQTQPMGCVQAQYFGCTVTTRIRCPATNSTAQCPAD